MKHRTLQPVDRQSTPQARGRRRPLTAHRWSLRRLGEDLVARKLDSAMQGMVRHEKYATAQIMAIRIEFQLAGPLRDLERHIAALEQLSDESHEIRQVVENLRADRRAILKAIRALRDIEAPGGLYGNREEAADATSGSRLVTPLEPIAASH